MTALNSSHIFYVGTGQLHQMFLNQFLNYNTFHLGTNKCITSQAIT